jgi:lysine-specific demethylase 8
MDTGAARSWRACAFVAPGAPGHARLSTLRERLRSVGGASAERTLTLVLDRLERDARPERVPPRPDGDASEARRSVTRACGVLVDLAWEKLHTGDWKDVDEAWRDLYVMAAMAAADARGGFAPARAAETLAALDRASLLGGPTFRDELERAIASAQEALAELQTAPSGAKRPRKKKRARALGDDAHDDVVAALPPGSLGEPSRASSSDDTRERESLHATVDDARSCCSRDANAEEEEISEKQPEPRVVVSRASERLRRLAALRSPIATFAAPPTLERFLTSARAPGAPAVLKGLARAWPALAKWRDPAYRRAVAGARTVPVETGEHYLHETHARELLTLDAFLDEYLSVGYSETEGDDFFDARATTGGDAPAKRRNAAADDADDRVRRRKKKKRKMGYLAQHALLDQIPALRRDVLVPDYCALTLERDDARAENEREGVAIRAWLGPRGTVSPTHRDPTHNLLVQAVGSKYVRLYAPSQERAMYLFSDPKRSNAARADPRDALAEKQARAFPAFSGAPFSDAVLEPGDALYVPPGWFHYVQSVTSSFSVSFWWR